MPVSGILGLIDGIILLSMSEEQFDKKYNKNISYKDWERRKRKEDYKERQYREERDFEDKRSRSRRYDPHGPRKVKQEPRKRKKVVRDNPFKRSGVKKYKDYDLDAAIEDFHKGLELEPNDISLHFNLACAYSLTEQVDKSYFHLSKAVANGFKDFEKIKTHDDLAFLRIHSGFHEFQSNNYVLDKTTKEVVVEKEKEPQTTEQKEEIKINEEDGLNDDILLSQLNKLDELRKKGLISDKEFQMEKRKLLRD